MRRLKGLEKGMWSTSRLQGQLQQQQQLFAERHLLERAHGGALFFVGVVCHQVLHWLGPMIRQVARAHDSSGVALARAHDLY